MTRIPLSLLSVGLLLSGCVPPPPGPYYAAPGYYYPQGAPPAAQPYVGQDGLAYDGGYPIGDVDGQQVPFVFVPELGGWGYYDSQRRWRGAPPEYRERFDRYHPGGQGLPPPGNYRGGPPPGGFRGGPPPGYVGGPPGRPPPGPGGFPGRPGGPPPQAIRPVAAQPPQGRAPPPPPQARRCGPGQERC